MAGGNGTRWVALLRGVNVGGRNLVPMARLRGSAAALGFADPETHLQSGNLIFRAEGAEAELVAALEARLRRDFGGPIPVVLRSAAELAKVARAHLLDGPGVDPGHLVVHFLAARPEKGAVAALDPERSAPDRFLVRGREIYACCPTGLARTKLTVDWFGKALGTTATARNWRTVTTLAAWP